MANEEKRERLPEPKLVNVFKEKPKAPKKLGHSLPDKRPHFKSFKSPGVK